jgi:hypothetical protein
MRRRLSQLTVAVLSTVLVAGTATAYGNKHRCHLGILDGLYVFSASGFAIPDSAPSFPKALIEVIRFNGDGTVEVPTATVSMNGAVTVAPPGGTGTYTVADLDPAENACTGTLTFSNPPHPSFNLVIPAGGAQVWMIMTSPASVLEGTAIKVSR